MLCCLCFFFCKQKTAYEMRISDWSSDVCSSDLGRDALLALGPMLLEHLGLPYTGCGARAIGMTTDKEVSKALMRAAAIPTPDWFGFGVSAGVGFASPVVDRMSGLLVP